MPQLRGKRVGLRPRQMNMVYKRQHIPVFPGGVAGQRPKEKVDEIRGQNAKEKKQMQDLNSRLAIHLEKVHKLEAENKYLHNSLEKSKIEFNVDKIKISYQDQLDYLKVLLDDKDKELAAIKSEKESFLEEIEDLREQLRHLEDENEKKQVDISKLNDEVTSLLVDNETSKRKIAVLDKQLADWKKRNDILGGQMAELRAKLQTETTQRLEFENHIAALEDEFAFNNDVHKSEVKEYETMLSKLQKLPNFEESWKSDIGAIVADLSAEYESRLETITQEIENRYEQQIRQITSAKAKTDVPDAPKNTGSHKEVRDLKTKLNESEIQIELLNNKIAALKDELERSQNQHAVETAKLKADITSLQTDLEAMITELQDLMNTKLSMELEIAAYRKLLEGEENRMGFASVMKKAGGFQTESEGILAKALTMAKVTMSRSTSGVVSVVELETEGKYIELEKIGNSDKGATVMKNWTLTQTFNDGKYLTHTFTDGNVFSSDKRIKIWGSKHGAKQDGITSKSVAEWGTMAIASTITLKDDKNKESAVLVIKSNS